MKTQHIEPPQPQPVLASKGHAGGGHTTSERKKHPRLNGADLYVARLGWCKGTAIQSAVKDLVRSAVNTSATTSADGVEDGSLSPSISSLSSGSLHDELLNPNPTPTPSASTVDPAIGSFDISTVRASRPCYRCITYMHSAGIKRVFWMNDAGEWEGGKVRDLVDALDASMENVVEGGPMGNGVFVTKHEVLMLRRKMGDC